MATSTQHQLNVEFDVHQFHLPAGEEQRLRDSLEGLARQVEHFPVADLHVLLEHNARNNDVFVKLSLILPGTTLVTTDHDVAAVPAFDRCLDSMTHSLKAYKDRLGNVPELQKSEHGTNRELHSNVVIDTATLDAAIAAEDYVAFRTATFPLEEDLTKLVGRWIQRYPDIEAQIGERIQIADLVEEVFLHAFAGYASRPASTSFGVWLQSLIDPAVKAIQQNPDAELEMIGLTRTALAAELDSKG
jgi:hypothetical protein